MSDEQTTTGAAWAIAALSVVGNVFQWLFGWLNNRDKLRFDAEIGALRNQNAGQAAEIASLKSTHQVCLDSHDETKSELRELRELFVRHFPAAAVPAPKS